MLFGAGRQQDTSTREKKSFRSLERVIQGGSRPVDEWCHVIVQLSITAGMMCHGLSLSEMLEFSKLSLEADYWFPSPALLPT